MGTIILLWHIFLLKCFLYLSMVPCEQLCRHATGKHRVNELRWDQAVLPQHTSKKIRFKGRKRKRETMTKWNRGAHRLMESPLCLGRTVYNNCLCSDYFLVCFCRERRDPVTWSVFWLESSTRDYLRDKCFTLWLVLHLFLLLITDKPRKEGLPCQ